MTGEFERPHRRSIRLQGYDYTQQGMYLITIVTLDRTCLFGEVVDGTMRFNAWGDTAHTCWREILAHFPQVALDVWVVMPNHLHGVIVINAPATVQPSVEAKIVGARHAVPLQADPQYSPPHPPIAERFGQPVSGSIPTIVRSYKSAVAKRINEFRGTTGAPVWQRNYYEHIIRDETSLQHIREYIVNNPLQWELDREHPTAGAIRPALPTKDEPWRH